MFCSYFIKSCISGQNVTYPFCLSSCSLRSRTPVCFQYVCFLLKGSTKCSAWAFLSPGGMKYVCMSCLRRTDMAEELQGCSSSSWHKFGAKYAKSLSILWQCVGYLVWETWITRSLPPQNSWASARWCGSACLRFFGSAANGITSV